MHGVEVNLVHGCTHTIGTKRVSIYLHKASRITRKYRIIAKLSRKIVSCCRWYKSTQCSACILPVLRRSDYCSSNRNDIEIRLCTRNIAVGSPKRTCCPWIRIAILIQSDESILDFEMIVPSISCTIIRHGGIGLENRLVGRQLLSRIHISASPTYWL
jgi:hypothetical protein